MKPITIVTVSLICFLWAGCNEQGNYTQDDYGVLNRELIDSYNDIAIHNAIIAQHTLYPYHFIPSPPGIPSEMLIRVESTPALVNVSKTNLTLVS